MARYDPDLIAALAAGLLEPAEADALEREIAADPRAAAQLAGQRLALQALRHAPAPVLSAEERTELRRAVAAALNLEQAPLAETGAARRRVPWRPIAVAAAALAALAAAVPLIGLLSVAGDNQAAVSTVAGADMVARSEDTAAGESAPLATTLGGEEAQADGGDLSATFANAEAATADAEKAIEDLLADPARLIASADAGLSTCEVEAADLLGVQNRPAAAALLRETGEMVVWFVSTDGTTLQRLAIFDPVGCGLLAAHP